MYQQYLKFRKAFEQEIQQINGGFSDVVFLCIGTNKMIGDAIGPTVGNSLKDIENPVIHVYGDKTKNLHFQNAKETIESIYAEFANPFLITVDAALSRRKPKGEIVLEKGYIKIGKALEKSLCFYSNLNIKCVVGTYYAEKEKNMAELSFIKQEEIYTMASMVASGIKNVLKKSNIYV